MSEEGVLQGGKPPASHWWVLRGLAGGPGSGAKPQCHHPGAWLLVWWWFGLVSALLNTSLQSSVPNKPSSGAVLVWPLQKGVSLWFPPRWCSTPHGCSKQGPMWEQNFLNCAKFFQTTKPPWSPWANTAQLLVSTWLLMSWEAAAAISQLRTRTTACRVAENNHGVKTSSASPENCPESFNWTQERRNPPGESRRGAGPGSGGARASLLPLLPCPGAAHIHPCYPPVPQNKPKGKPNPKGPTAPRAGAAPAQAPDMARGCSEKKQLKKCNFFLKKSPSHWGSTLQTTGCIWTLITFTVWGRCSLDESRAGWGLGWRWAWGQEWSCRWEWGLGWGWGWGQGWGWGPSSPGAGVQHQGNHSRVGFGSGQPARAHTYPARLQVCGNLGSPGPLGSCSAA